MIKIGIVCALTHELELIKNTLVNAREEESAFGKYYIGEINNVLAIACVCGVGKVNAAIRTQYMIDKYKVERVINSGIAGSLSEKAGHLSVVVADKLYYHDFSQAIMQEYFPYVSHFCSNQDMREAFLQANSKEIDILIGNIATGDEFVQSFERKMLIASIMNGVCVEMEGASVAHTAFANQLPVLVVRAISDMADSNADFDYDKFEVLASIKVSTYLIKYLKSV